MRISSESALSITAVWRLVVLGVRGHSRTSIAAHDYTNEEILGFVNTVGS
jgi:hypothetical protein